MLFKYSGNVWLYTKEKPNLETTSIVEAIKGRYLFPQSEWPKTALPNAITDRQLSAQPETMDLAEGANAKM